MRRAYKLRAYPTRPQETRAHRLLHDHCDLYNAALQERRDAWRMQQTLISYRDQSAQLKEIRANDPAGQGRHSFTAQQQTLRRLDVVFGAFYKRVKEPTKRSDGLSEATTSTSASRNPTRRSDGQRGEATASQNAGSAARGSRPVSGSTKSCSLQVTAPSGSPPVTAGGRMRAFRRSVGSR